MGDNLSYLVFCVRKWVSLSNFRTYSYMIMNIVLVSAQSSFCRLCCSSFDVCLRIWSWLSYLWVGTVLVTCLCYQYKRCIDVDSYRLEEFPLHMSRRPLFIIRWSCSTFSLLSSLLPSLLLSSWPACICLPICVCFFAERLPILFREICIQLWPALRLFYFRTMQIDIDQA